jgi:hypothetical protein
LHPSFWNLANVFGKFAKYEKQDLGKEKGKRKGGTIGGIGDGVEIGVTTYC